ncbi:MAG: 2-amino-4-hydroxy-6-hydroxymethyldihydropteridine diphosphokinase [Bacteroidetes bacterium 24-39-8]|jgi:2-amino-4-hydroxy-6-hydroxymethyldihydropteridine diphosphokinase|nr:MAG: 2-amino-4-hydroxy-6-hydroxymethyldihydropteridine diphosphokinase [Sphingobacteriia bacterium 35-40-8]OYZ50012.1 MAG: 2-amino-4-hydroxy-6-hydroxymethyldihydropteridine diphosphokinase [Bacteroidetes bacterium 24-39-8]OZA67701.1 MAG: 2-amino-4-hydroxy-6-hydroxymethyldihydropteridine diphosphokinase [Sphingobacteriia bacterium 39-39-8]HQR93574.1 2-amino-4-hydroxy-6-hydroxymethyldihydropteridine diphosphokinase [Sediminibacterium sp.]HQS53836.1 2-amino-4-hydroxy-6-hydroxymethyldihydropteri
MSTAYLLIGGNLGNRSANLQKAVFNIEQTCGKIVQSSAIYETSAWGLTQQPAFYNQALIVSTQHSPEKLMQALLEIEIQMGRTREIKMGPRVIDLDILLIDQLVQHTNLLQLPHPSLTMRRFALLPLAEIAPDLLHPLVQKTIQQLLEICPDQLDVQKLSTVA